MRLHVIAAGDTQQINGPHYGVRVLVAAAGAALVCGAIALPVDRCLPTLAETIGKVIATGPITFMLGDRDGEDLSRAAGASEQGLDGRVTQRVRIGAGTTMYPGVAVAAFTRPPRADAFALVQESGDRYYWHSDFRWGTQGYGFDGGFSGVVPCVYVLWNGADGVPRYPTMSWPAANLPAPDSVTWGKSTAIGPQTVAQSIELTGLWWAAGRRP